MFGADPAAHIHPLGSYNGYKQFQQMCINVHKDDQSYEAPILILKRVAKHEAECTEANALV